MMSNSTYKKSDNDRYRSVEYHLKNPLLWSDGITTYPSISSYWGETATIPHSIYDDTSWFYTDEWQAKEKEADLDFECGNYSSVETMDDLLAIFDVQEKEIKKNTE